MANLEANDASVAPSNRPAFGYTLNLLWFYLFIMIYLPCLSSVRIVLTLVAMIYDMSFLHMLNLVVQFVMIYILILIWKLPKISTPASILVSGRTCQA
jgi:Fe2+ transport system protein B